MSLVAENCYVRASDGALLRFEVRDAGAGARGALVTVHGLGEHVEKYGEWFEAVLARGYHVAAHDQRGHGGTPGRRGDFAFPDLVDDLDRFVAVVRDRFPPDPIFVVGHSLGALVSLLWARERGDGAAAVAGVVACSPPVSLAVKRPGWKRLGIRALARVAPRLRLPRGTVPARLSRDPERVAAIERDGKIHRSITPRAMVTTTEAMETLRSLPCRFDVPLLVLVAGEDAVASPDATLEWGRAVEGRDVTVVQVPGGYHELLNDLGREGTYGRILDWCEARADG